QPAETFTVAGFVAAKARWRDFEARWTRLLRREGLTAFNAHDFAHETGEFAAGWHDPARRRNLLDSLGRIAEQHVYRAFSQSIRQAEYDAADAQHSLSQRGGGPYAVCAAFLMTSVRDWMAAKHPDDLTIFVFEQGDLEQRQLHRMLEPAGTHVGEPAQLWPR